MSGITESAHDRQVKVLPGWQPDNGLRAISFGGWLMGLILLVAATARGYDLDYASLWSDELANVLAASRGDTIDMLQRLLVSDADVPGYRWLLRVMLHWFGGADFAVRLLSALSGIAAVWLVWRLADEARSKTAGWLAAALLACNFNAIAFSQEAGSFIVLMPLALLHLVLFYRLFLCADQQGVAPLRLSAGRGGWQLAIQWQPPVPVPPRSLAGFWLTGVAMLYVDYMGLLVLLTELVALALPGFTPRTSETRRLLFWCYVPVLLCWLPWLPVAVLQGMRVASLQAFPAPKLMDVWDGLRFLLGPDPLRVWALLAGLVLSALVAVQQWRAGDERYRLWCLCVMLAFLPWLLLWLFSRLCFSLYDPRFLVFAIAFLCLAVACGLAAWLERISSETGFRVVLVIVLLVMVTALMLNNVDRKLYKNKRKAEIRQSVELVLKDTAFMQGARRVFASHEFFLHYFDFYQLHSAKDEVLNYKLPEEAVRANVVLSERDFYYLELLAQPGRYLPSPVLAGLEQRYRKLCETRFRWVKVVKFRTNEKPVPDHVTECPAG